MNSDKFWVRLTFGLAIFIALGAANSAHANFIDELTGAAQRRPSAESCQAILENPNVAERRQSTLTLPQTPLRTSARHNFTMAHLKYNPTTAKQNKAWIAIAETPFNTEDPVLFVDIEIAVLQMLNKITKDRDFATALTNFHKKLLFQGLDELEKKYPGFEFFYYSDYKSVRIAVRGSRTPEFHTNLAKTLAEVNEAFVREVLGQTTSSAVAVVRQTDNPETWFRAGCSETSADLANAQARFARKQTEGNVLKNCDDTEALKHLELLLGQIEATRLGLEEKFNLPGVMTGPRRERQLIWEIVNLVRKNSDPIALLGQVQKETGKSNLTLEDALVLIKYVKDVDEFSPGLYNPERRIVNLDDADSGGISADFIGTGSFNWMETADAVMRAYQQRNTYSGPRLVTYALQLSRLGEKRVTVKLNGKLAAFRDVTGGDCSGEDCASAFKSAQSREDKQKLMNQLARKLNIRQIRVATVAAHVPREFRSILSSHGESIADYVRAELLRVLPDSTIARITVAVDMRTNRLNRGQVGLIVGLNQITLSQRDQDAIKQALRHALDRYNTFARETYKTISNYRPDFEPLN